ncbi:MAG: ADP-forming succinate--CoA ligase subunit beta [Candidatus Methylomirabilales bacterium]
MKIHEYQAKEFLASYGIPIPRGNVVTSASDAKEAAARLGGTVVVKAQIHAGGRGKGGGVKLTRSPTEAEQAATSLLGRPLVTPQTGPQGTVVHRLLIEEAVAIARELYLGVVVDRKQGLPVVMASGAGGMEIEEVAARTPEQILQVSVVPAMGLSPYASRKIGFGLGLGGDQVRELNEVIGRLYRLFIERDASLVEVNPLVLTEEGRFVALDAKISFDDNALFRHPGLLDLRDLDEEAPLEIEAGKFRLNYIKLDGNIGCMVNGAGLAMATMDIVKLHGGSPANFLDVGGGASAEQVENAFRILLSDPGVHVVLINVFGGILRCDRLAEGVITAVQKLRVRVPVVIRMEGTNVERGREMLRESGLHFITAQGMGKAAELAVAAARNAR